MTPEEFYSSLASLALTNEASVETRIINQLLLMLGYRLEDISPKHSIEFVQGRRGRKPEADYVVFDGTPHTKDNSLIIVEAKAPKEKLNNAKSQAESYAFAMRAPFYVLINGSVIEVWQLQYTKESKVIFSSELNRLAERRGELEAMLGRDAVVEHCKNLHIKELSFHKFDVASYVDAELRRTERISSVINRVLEYPAGGSVKQVRTDQLLEEFVDGALVLAPSGYGKSTLSTQLHRQRLRDIRGGLERAVSFEIYLPDVVSHDESIVSYARQRLAAYCAAFATDSSFRQRLARSGALLLLDGLDRLKMPERERVISEIRALMRDYPTCQIVLFSRPASSSPIHDLPTLNLTNLHPREQKEIADAMSPNGHSVYGVVSTYLKSSCSIPYVLTMAIHHILRTGQVSTGLVHLFRSWIDESLSRCLLDEQCRIECEFGLRLIANATAKSSIPLAELNRLMDVNRLPMSTIGVLVRCDLVLVTSSRVELAHEVLADFLRADTVMAGRVSTELAATLEQVQIDVGSAMAMFLVALANDAESQRLVLDALCKRNLLSYWSVLQMQSSIIDDAAVGSRAHQEWYLGEMLRGCQILLHDYFSATERILFDELTAQRDPSTHGLGIVGCLHPEGTGVSYSFIRVPEREGCVHVAESASDLRRRGFLIHGHIHRGNVADVQGARFLGTTSFRNSLRKAIDKRRLPGGPTWSKEHFLSYIPWLSDVFGLDVFDMSIVQLIGFLEQFSGKEFLHQNRVRVYPDDLLEDLRLLREAGESKPRDWLFPGPDHVNEEVCHWSDRFSPDAFGRMVCEAFRRSIFAYREVVERCFSSVAQLLYWYPHVPISYELSIWRESSARFVVYPKWMPVERWEDVRVSARWIDEPSVDQWCGYEATLRHALASLGRASDRWSYIQWLYFYESNWSGERFAVEMASKWLMVDVDHLFRALPGARDLSG